MYECGYSMCMSVYTCGKNCLCLCMRRLEKDVRYSPSLSAIFPPDRIFHRNQNLLFFGGPQRSSLGLPPQCGSWQARRHTWPLDRCWRCDSGPSPPAACAPPKPPRQPLCLVFWAGPSLWTWARLAGQPALGILSSLPSNQGLNYRQLILCPDFYVIAGGADSMLLPGFHWLSHLWRHGSFFCAVRLNDEVCLVRGTM